MAHQRDPFRLDIPANHVRGKWMRETWDRLDIKKGIHIRGIHYAILGQPKPDGSTHRNTDKDQDWLLELGDSYCLDTNERGRVAMTSQPDQYELEVFDSNSMGWLEIPIEQIGRSLPLKLFTADPDTGMSCALMRYDAGFINPWHTHRCAHGMFVLSGTLRTHEGDFGPGSFVWFPEGMTMYHGATEDSDCLMLFITNKPFNIRYTFEDEPSGSEAERLGREKACLCSMASVT